MVTRGKSQPLPGKARLMSPSYFQGLPSCNDFCYGLTICIRYVNNRVKVSRFHSALSMVKLALRADLYFLSLKGCFCEHSYPGKIICGMCDCQV